MDVEVAPPETELASTEEVASSPPAVVVKPSLVAESLEVVFTSVLELDLRSKLLSEEVV